MKKLRRFTYNNIVTISISIVFIVVYVVNTCVGDHAVFNSLSGSGFRMLNGQVYRIFTASFLHASLLHLVANVGALICVGSFLEKRLGSLKMLLIYAAFDIVASLLFYGYMNECTNGNGSSIAIYAMFALLLVLWLRYPNEFLFSWHNPAFIYIMVYFFVGSFVSGNYTTIIIHAFSFVTGLVVSIILLKGNLLIEE